LTFAVQEGECFGFLGTNGAGKSTTLSMLCGKLSYLMLDMFDDFHQHTVCSSILVSNIWISLKFVMPALSKSMAFPHPIEFDSTI